jgi:hypothetical protein
MKLLHRYIPILLTGIFSLLCCSANAANIAGLSGTYVCLTNRNFAPFAANIVGVSGVGSNVLGLYNMDTLQMSGIVSITTGWGQSSPTPVQSNLAANGSFKISSGLIAGSYTITNYFTVVEGSKKNNVTNSMNMIPANSGNTLFISMVPNPDSAKIPETGVCQKQ